MSYSMTMWTAVRLIKVTANSVEHPGSAQPRGFLQADPVCGGRLDVPTQPSQSATLFCPITADFREAYRWTAPSASSAPSWAEVTPVSPVMSSRS